MLLSFAFGWLATAWFNRIWGKWCYRWLLRLGHDCLQLLLLLTQSKPGAMLNCIALSLPGGKVLQRVLDDGPNWTPSWLPALTAKAQHLACAGWLSHQTVSVPADIVLQWKKRLPVRIMQPNPSPNSWPIHFEQNKKVPLSHQIL